MSPGRASRGTANNDQPAASASQATAKSAAESKEKEEPKLTLKEATALLQAVEQRVPYIVVPEMRYA